MESLIFRAIEVRSAVERNQSSRLGRDRAADSAPSLADALRKTGPKD